jgi:hypothetical protein
MFYVETSINLGVGSFSVALSSIVLEPRQVFSTLMGSILK